jgi:hypothetical protein
MVKTTFYGTGRLATLLGLAGLLSCGTSLVVRAQDNPRAEESAPAGPDSAQQDGGQYTPPENSRGYDNAGPRNDVGAPDGDNSAEAPDADVDPPSRVAQLSYLDGSVSMQPGGSGDWSSAARNRPITIGDKLWVDKDARAELQAGQTTIHLGGMTALSFLNLDRTITQMRLAEGSINFRVREMREGDLYEVDTPNAAFTVRQAGAFRIDVNENGDGTIVTVLRGEGEVVAAGQTYTVRGGELAEFNGTDGNVEYHRDRAPEADDFDRWSADRDRREEDSVSAKYVSRDTVGYAELDNNGTWNEEPEYGHVWYPNQVAVGWAPYSYGYWNWVGPWGWTWVDYSPWGFAPFHYGRWHYFGSRWGWCPGPIGYYPIYGPAYVGFLGGGFGFGVGVGFGVGWFPLGFGEIYHPWYGYRHGGAYIRNINVHNTYIRNVNNITNRNFRSNYAYAHNPAAVSATTRNGFVSGQRVDRSSRHLNEASLRNAQVTNRVNATPTRASFGGAAGARGGRVATPPTSIQNRAVIARTTPAPAASHIGVRTLGSTSVAGRNTAYSHSTGRTTQVPRPYNNGANSVGRSAGNAPTMRSDRPNSATVNSQPRNHANRPPYANSRTYNQGGSAQRPYAAPQRGYSAPQRTYSAPQQRTYSAPSRGGYSAPHSAPAPSHAPSGGGHPSGGGGSSPHGGGGSNSHGSGPHGH